MALMMFTGFETGAIATSLWDDNNGTVTAGSGSARSGTGTYYASLSGSAGLGYTATSPLAASWDSSTELLHAGFAVRIADVTATAVSLFSMGHDLGVNRLFYMTLDLATTGALTAYAADTQNGTDATIGTSVSGVIQSATWHYVEVLFWPDQTNGRLKIVVDGMVPTAASGSLDFTGDTMIDTGTRAAGDITMKFRGVAGSTTLLDDVYVCTDTTSGNDPFTGLMGEQCVEALVPTSDSSTAWTRSTGTTNYETVDEKPPVETDYVETTNAADEDIYGLGNTTLSGTANAVSTMIRAWQNTVTTGQVRTEINSSASTTNGATHNLSGTGTDFVDFFPVDPNASAAWSNSAVDAATVSIYCVAVT